MKELVLFEQHAEIAILRLNRPEKLNALNYALNDQLLSNLEKIELNQSIRSVIITGAGDRAFSAGGDIYEFSNSIKQGVDVAMRDFVRRGQQMTSRIENYPKPIIAAINGLAFGGGCEITEAAHLAIASDRAVFAKPEIAIGIPPTFGGTQRLPRLVGRKRALELLLTGDQFSAKQAYEMGLVNKVVAHNELLPGAIALAERILCHSPLASARILNAVARGTNVSIAQGLAIEAEQFARMVPTEDIREGLDAWIERRQPHYCGQ